MMKSDLSIQQLHHKAKYYLSQKQYSEAIAICQQALTLQPGSEIANKIYKILGIACQMQGESEKAFQFYLKSLEIKPDDPEVYHNIGSLYAQKKQWQDAIISYQAALNLDPKLESAYLNLGNVQIKLSQFDEAIACYYQLIKFAPNLASAYQKLGDIFFQLQQWDEAIFNFSRVIELHPNSAWSYQHLGKIYTHKQQYENAIKACIHAIKINPKAAWSYNNLGDIFSDKQDWNLAAIAYIHAIKVRENPYKLGFMNRIYQRLGYVMRQQIKQSNLERVTAWYSQIFQQKEEQYLSNYPFNITELGFIINNIEPYLQMGEVFIRCQQFEAALIFYKLALEIQPNDLEIYKKVIQTYHQKQRLEQTITNCHENINKHPNSPDAYTELGNILTQQGQAQEAIHYHQKALILKGWDLCQERNYQFTQDWFSDNIPIWTKHLNVLRNTPESQILEVGSYQGMSTCWFLDHLLTHPTARITCIDPYFKPEFEYNIAQTSAAQKVIKKIGYSQDILSSLPANFYDIVYIDGSHLAKDTLEEALQAWRLTKVGGTIIFDDYEVKDKSNPEQQAKVGIDYFLKWVLNSIQVIHKGYQLIIRKQKTGLSDEEIATYLTHITQDDFQL